MKLHHLLLPLCLFVSPVAAQITDLPKRTENTLFRDRVKPNWLRDGASVGDRVKTATQAKGQVAGAKNSRGGESGAAPRLRMQRGDERRDGREQVKAQEKHMIGVIGFPKPQTHPHQRRDRRREEQQRGE